MKTNLIPAVAGFDRPSTAFRGGSVFRAGPLAEVAQAVRASGYDAMQSILVFDDSDGSVIDIDIRDDAHSDSPGCAVLARRRGRPRLGVVAREVTLMPRHWEWLNVQRGGASAALRRLVDEARKANSPREHDRTLVAAAYRFMSTMAGDYPGFEEASRALFAGDRARFEGQIGAWPPDVQRYLRKLAN